MKSIIKLLTLLSVFIYYSCGKEPAMNQPQPQSSNYFRVEIKDLPGSNTIMQQSYVLLSVMNEQNEEVLKNRKLILSHDGSSYKTARLLLGAGRYRVTSLMIRNNNDSLMYAAPRTNSVRAAEVINPLYLAFNLPSKNDLMLPVEVASVQHGDQPSHFGYADGSFGVPSESPNSEYFKVGVRIKLTIGDIVYDSIPSTLKITIWDKQNQEKLVYKELSPGMNDVLLPRLANKYSLLIEKWGYAEQKFIDPATINANTSYEFNGVMESRILRSEITYRVIDGTDKAETKTLYLYNPEKKIHQVLHYKKKNDGTPYLAFTDDYRYNGAQLENIRRKDETGTETESTLFIRNAEGQPQAITQSTNSGITTSALVNYYSAEGFTGIHVNYKYSHHSNMLDYDMRFAAGNMSESAAMRANTTAEMGTYQYDQNINPYAVMHLDDLFFSNVSKNNRVAQYKQYTGSMPEADVYEYQYTYDQFGYPKQVIKKYKSPLLNQHSFTTKTIYNYD